MQRSVANVAIFKLIIFQRTSVNFALNSDFSKFCLGFPEMAKPFYGLKFWVNCEPVRKRN